MNLDFINLPSAKINQFNKKNIYTIEDLVRFIPRKYYDFRYPKVVDNLHDGEFCSIIVTIDSMNVQPTRNGECLKINCHDEKNQWVIVYFFNAVYLQKLYSVDDKVIICGKVQINTSMYSRVAVFSNPIKMTKDIDSSKKIIPVYSKIKGMSDDYLKNSIDKAITVFNQQEYIEQSILSKYKLQEINTALTNLHHPDDISDIKNGKLRLIFDDLFFFNYMLKRKEEKMSKNTSYIFKTHTLVDKYINSLPYKLTPDQGKTINTLYKKTRMKEKINCIIQGDVGCGKTEIAKCMLLLAAEAGYQSVFLAPTGVLAKQHYEDCVRSFSSLGIKVVFLSSELKKSERKKILKSIENKDANIIVGTHSVLSDEIMYKDLSLVIVDEEHKFGVKQREKLIKMTNNNTHFISMSATLIPRTLATTIYGNAEVISIKTLPKGKKPIITKKITDKNNGYDLVDKELQSGHQIYVVCPLIEESESSVEHSINDVGNVLKEFKRIYSNYSVEMINGSMKDEEISDIINRFNDNKVQILISTTIIEVGVNVPNSTVIWIKSAERFGVAQLHQLRGRVGRGKDQGYCLLESSEGYINKETVNIDILCKSNDGFVIAQEDLKTRGSGDIIGTQQSGIDHYIELLTSYPKISNAIKSEVEDIFKDKDRMNFYEETLYKEILSKEY